MNDEGWKIHNGVWKENTHSAHRRPPYNSSDSVCRASYESCSMVYILKETLERRCSVVYYLRANFIILSKKCFQRKNMFYFVTYIAVAGGVFLQCMCRIQMQGTKPFLSLEELSSVGCFYCCGVWRSWWNGISQSWKSMVQAKWKANGKSGTAPTGFGWECYGNGGFSPTGVTLSRLSILWKECEPWRSLPTPTILWFCEKRITKQRTLS